MPKWTRRVAVEDGGRDPLGLSRVSSSITDHLLTGITSQTRRARYYSFYCWVLWHIHLTEGRISWKVFEEAFRRRDTLFAMSSLVYNKDSQVVGVDAIRPRLQKAEHAAEVPCDYRALPSAYLGAFDQYYKGSLYNLSLWSSTSDGVHHATEKAVSLAKAFHHTIENTPYIGKQLFNDNAVLWRDLIKTKDDFNLDRLGLPPVPEERELLVDLFFYDSSEPGRRRQQTLALILHTISAYEEAGASLQVAKDLDWQLLYGPHYYDQLVECNRVRRYHAPAKLSDCHLMWRQFCLHEYLTQALEHLLSGTLEMLSGESNGLSLAGISSRLFGPGLRTALSKIHGRKCSTPSVLFNQIGLKGVPDAASCDRFQRDLHSDHPYSEAAILDRAEVGTAEDLAAVAVSILATMYAKWRAILPKATERLAGAELWARPVMKAIDEWWASSDWIIAADILHRFVLQQHDNVMFEKGLLKRWFDYQDGRYIKEQDYDAEWRNSRHESCIGILSDLGLIQASPSGSASLTAFGRRTLKLLLGQ